MQMATRPAHTSCIQRPTGSAVARCAALPPPRPGVVVRSEKRKSTEPLQVDPPSLLSRQTATSAPSPCTLAAAPLAATTRRANMLARTAWQPFTSAAPAGGQQRVHSSRAGRVLAPPRAAAAEQPQGSNAAASSDSYEFTYRGSDGRVKATFEQAFKNKVGSGSSSSSGSSGSGGCGEAAAPWALSYQMSERYSMLWNDDLKARMLKVRGVGGRFGTVQYLARHGPALDAPPSCAAMHRCSARRQRSWASLMRPWRSDCSGCFCCCPTCSRS